MKGRIDLNQSQFVVLTTLEWRFPIFITFRSRIPISKNKRVIFSYIALNVVVSYLKFFWLDWLIAITSIGEEIATSEVIKTYFFHLIVTFKKVG